MASATKVESNLEAKVLEQFDNLVKKGEIFWEPTEEIKCEQEPFDVGLFRALGWPDADSSTNRSTSVFHPY